MTNVKLFFIFFVFFFSISNTIQAEDSQVLELNFNERNKSIFFENNESCLIKANSNFYYKDEDIMDMENYTKDNEDVFETKYGKAFAKFIDSRVINNKFADMPSKLNEKQKF